MEHTAKDTSGEVRRKILIAEDDPNILELLKLYMCRDGFEVETAVNGGEALAKFRIFKPDLVLLDVMMPVLDGWEVCGTIRKESDVPVIMLTARRFSERRVFYGYRRQRPRRNQKAAPLRRKNLARFARGDGFSPALHDLRPRTFDPALQGRKKHSPRSCTRSVEFRLYFC